MAVTYSITETVVPNFEIRDVNVYFTGLYPNRTGVEYYIYLAEEKTASLISKIQDSTSSQVASVDTNIARTIKYKGVLYPGTTVYMPRFRDGKLVRVKEPISSIPDCYSVHFRGKFDVFVTATIKEYKYGRELVSFFIDTMTPTSEYMKYMGDEVFPDWLIDGTGISNEQLNKFMDTY